MRPLFVDDQKKVIAKSAQGRSVLHIVLGVSRVRFLLLTPACLLPGVALASAHGAHLDIGVVLLIFLGAVAAHVAVNAYNEVHDFDSGLDLRTRRTPYSGGSGTLPENPDARKVAVATAHIAIAIAVSSGIMLLQFAGWRLLPIGLLGLVLVLTYSSWIQRHWWLCLLAPGIGFGGLMTAGAYVVLTGNYGLPIALVSLVPFFMVNNLLLLNQLPDREADRAVGRRHLLVCFGSALLMPVYSVISLAAASVLLVVLVHPQVPAGAAAGLAGWLPTVWVAGVLLRRPIPQKRLMGAMALNVLATLLTPLIMALGIISL